MLQGVYLGFSHLREIEDVHGLRHIWGGASLPEQVMMDVSPPYSTINKTSLWAMGNRFISRFVCRVALAGGRLRRWHAGTMVRRAGKRTRARSSEQGHPASLIPAPSAPYLPQTCLPPLPTPQRA